MACPKCGKSRTHVENLNLLLAHKLKGTEQLEAILDVWDNTDYFEDADDVAEVLPARYAKMIDEFGMDDLIYEVRQELRRSKK